MKCLNCKTDTRNPKFCTMSCAATYNNRKFPRRKSTKLKSKCLNCGSFVEYYPNQGMRKYCSRQCCGQHKYKTISIPKILAGNRVTNTAIRTYLIGTVGNKCSVCNQPNSWNGRPLILQLDHIDGNRDNWTLGNLRLICPNCHTQTDTYSGRNNNGTTVSDSELLKLLKSSKTINIALKTAKLASNMSNYTRCKKLCARV